MKFVKWNQDIATKDQRLQEIGVLAVKRFVTIFIEIKNFERQGF